MNITKLSLFLLTTLASITTHSSIRTTRVFLPHSSKITTYFAKRACSVQEPSNPKTTFTDSASSNATMQEMLDTLKMIHKDQQKTYEKVDQTTWCVTMLTMIISIKILAHDF